MRGRGMYFYALKEDFLEEIKALEERLGGLQYVNMLPYKEPVFEIYNSVEDLPDIGTIKEGMIDGKFYDQWNYLVLFKGERFQYRKVDLFAGGNHYFVENKEGTITFKPSGLHMNTNCVADGNITTVAEDEKGQLLFKEFKKALQKNMQYIGALYYVGKSIIEKKNYRLPYGGKVEADPEYDVNLSKLEWKEKKKTKSKK